MTIKATILFQDSRSGWSESFYFVGDYGPTNGARADDLVAERRKVLGYGAKITAVRVQSVEDPLKVDLFGYDSQGLAEDGSGSQRRLRRADQPHVAILMPYKTPGGVRRHVTVSSFPDTWMERPEDHKEMALTEAGVEKLNLWYNWLLRTPWPLAIRRRVRTGGNAPKEISNIIEDDKGRYRIIMKEAFPLVLPAKVTLTKLKGKNLANAAGIRKVVKIWSATEFSIDRGRRADLGDIEVDEGAFCSLIGYTYDQAQVTLEPYKLTTRKRGRPFAPRRGRRSHRR